MKAALLSLCRSHVVHEAAASVQDCLLADLTGPLPVFAGRQLSLKFPPYPNVGRNRLTQQALAQWPELDALLWVDDDTGFSPHQALSLLACLDAEHPVVSGLYFTPGPSAGSVLPVLLQSHPSGVGFEHMKTWPEDTLLPVATVGMGFCAIQASLLRDYAAEHGPTWFDYARDAAGRFMLEDSSFCTRVRARGHAINVHTGIVVDHWKTVPINAHTWAAQQALASTINSP